MFHLPYSCLLGNGSFLNQFLYSVDAVSALSAHHEVLDAVGRAQALQGSLAYPKYSCYITACQHKFHASPFGIFPRIGIYESYQLCHVGNLFCQHLKG